MNACCGRSSPGCLVRGARGATASILILALAATLLSPLPSWGASSDKKLVNVAKTTVIGALLGGLLGVTSALVVNKDSRGDAIRWGIAIGAFAGFAYGIYGLTHDSSDLSLGPEWTRPADPGVRGGVADGADLVREWRLGRGAIGSRGDVRHDQFEKEADWITQEGTEQASGIRPVPLGITP